MLTQPKAPRSNIYGKQIVALMRLPESPRAGYVCCGVKVVCDLLTAKLNLLSSSADVLDPAATLLGEVSASWVDVGSSSPDSLMLDSAIQVLGGAFFCNISVATAIMEWQSKSKESVLGQLS